MTHICKKAHRYYSSFSSLSKNQGKIGRHKYCGCAFELGYDHAICGLSKADNDSVLKHIPASQAGTVRHKDAFEAYRTGFKCNAFNKHGSGVSFKSDFGRFFHLWIYIYQIFMSFLRIYLVLNLVFL